MMKVLPVAKRVRSYCGENEVSWFRTVPLTLALVLGLWHSVLAGGFVPTTGSLQVARKSHAATLLVDGRLLFTGGEDSSSTPLNSAEIFDPGTEQCTLQSNMQSHRAFHTATLLNDGKVLIVGGSADGSYPLATAEIFDPTLGTFTSTGSMSFPRARHTATLLPNGTVLITGGVSGQYLSSSSARSDAEIYDPSQGKFLTPVVSMHAARFGHTATTIDNVTDTSKKLVLIAGGKDSSAEIYDPLAGTFTSTGSLTTVRRFHTAIRLPNNTVLITGGQAGSSLTTLATAEIYTPNAIPSSGIFAATTNPLNAQRQYHQANLLANGKALISGGSYWFGSSTQFALNSTEQYEYPDVFFSVAANMNSDRVFHTSTTLADGVSVLVAGGTDLSSALSSIEMYNSANIKVRPLAYSFGNTTVNTLQSHDFTITNSLQADQVLTIVFSGTDAAMFSATGCSSVPAGGSCTVTVTFQPTSLGNKQATMDISDTIGDTVSVAMTGTVVPTYLLTVNASGNGTGTVTSTPAGINNCPLGPTSLTCSATFAAGQITLAANPSGSPTSSANASYFSGWSGATGCSGNSCIFTLSEPTTVYAGFYLYPVTIGKTTYFSTLQDAYNGATSGNEIRVAGSYNVSQAVDFARDNIAVVVKGGYDDGFSSITDYSTIGTLTIGKGSAVVDRLTIH
jgi:hypothetical protein